MDQELKKHCPLNSDLNTCFLFCMRVYQRWARIRAGSGLKPILAGSGLDCKCFENWQIRTGSDWENVYYVNVIILNISKLLVVVRFCRFAKWRCIFCCQWQ